MALFVSIIGEGTLSVKEEPLITVGFRVNQIEIIF